MGARKREFPCPQHVRAHKTPQNSRLLARARTQGSKRTSNARTRARTGTLTHRSGRQIEGGTVDGAGGQRQVDGTRSLASAPPVLPVRPSRQRLRLPASKPSTGSEGGGRKREEGEGEEEGEERERKGGEGRRGRDQEKLALRMQRQVTGQRQRQRLVTGQGWGLNATSTRVHRVQRCKRVERRGSSKRVRHVMRVRHVSMRVSHVSPATATASTTTPISSACGRSSCLKGNGGLEGVGHVGSTRPLLACALPSSHGRRHSGSGVYVACTLHTCTCRRPAVHSACALAVISCLRHFESCCRRV
jgi:hypothetical protein